jgi:hypothetical protein
MSWALLASVLQFWLISTSFSHLILLDIFILMFIPLVGKSDSVHGRWGSAAKGAMGGFPPQP